MKCIVPVEKFSEYVFKPGATHGKDQVFATLGYSREHSVVLAEIYARLAAESYAAGNYVLNRQDEHGQRVTISIELNGVGDHADNRATLRTGWMQEPDGRLRLLTPFSGYGSILGEEDAE